MMQSSVWKECLAGLMENGLENATPKTKEVFDDICGAMTDQVAFAGIVGKVKQMDSKMFQVNRTIEQAGIDARKALNAVNDAINDLRKQQEKVRKMAMDAQRIVDLKESCKMDDRAMNAYMLFDNILTRGASLGRLDNEQLIRSAGNICSAYLMGGNVELADREELTQAIDGLKQAAQTKKIGRKF